MLYDICQLSSLMILVIFTVLKRHVSMRVDRVSSLTEPGFLCIVCMFSFFFFFFFFFSYNGVRLAVVCMFSFTYKLTD